MVQAIVILDGEGERVTAKYFSKDTLATKEQQIDLEKKMHKKSRASSSGEGEQLCGAGGLSNFLNVSFLFFFLYFCVGWASWPQLKSLCWMTTSSPFAPLGTFAFML